MLMQCNGQASREAEEHHRSRKWALGVTNFIRQIGKKTPHRLRRDAQHFLSTFPIANIHRHNESWRERQTINKESFNRPTSPLIGIMSDATRRDECIIRIFYAKHRLQHHRLLHSFFPHSPACTFNDVLTTQFIFTVVALQQHLQPGWVQFNFRIMCCSAAFNSFSSCGIDDAIDVSTIETLHNRWNVSSSNFF